MSTFPTVRMRRTRQNETMRSLVRETHLAVEQLIYPLFISRRFLNWSMVELLKMGGFAGLRAEGVTPTFLLTLSLLREAMRSSVRTGIVRLDLRSYSAKPGIISTILA